VSTAMNRIRRETAEHLGPPPANVTEALAHVLRAFADSPDDRMVLQATSGIYGNGVRTGLTMGDLRALQAELVRLRAANATGRRGCPQCDEEQTTCTLCGASLEA
jgi:hypothetical protein